MENKKLNIRARHGSIMLLEEKGRIALNELPGTDRAESWVVCDFFPHNFPRKSATPWGYRHDAGHLVDHHAPDARFQRHVSSGNLAVQYAKENVPPELVFINHTDCDSVLSAGIVSGYLSPRPEYEAAVIAADHTGEANVLADTLQAVQDEADLMLLYGALTNYELFGTPLSEAYPEPYERRIAARARAEAIAPRPHFVSEKFVMYCTDEKIESELLAPFVPCGWFFLLVMPMENRPHRYQVKVRLTRFAPEDFSLHSVDLRRHIPGYGGRWNAGSNRRGGGTTVEVSELIHGVEYAMRWSGWYRRSHPDCV